MTYFDKVISGASVVTESAVVDADIGIRGEKIAALAQPGSLLGSEVLDASGCVVIPGGIDPHVHCDWPVWLEGEPPFPRSASPDVVSLAAAFGGTTTLIDFAVPEPGERVEDCLDRTHDVWSGSHIDFAHHLMVTGDNYEGVVDQIPEAIQAGLASVKVFTTDITPSRRGRKLTSGRIENVLRQVSRNSGIVAVHAEDDELVMHGYATHAARGTEQLRHMPCIHSEISERLAFDKMITLARYAEECPLYFMHISAGTGVRAVAAAQADGQRVYGETLHSYAMFSNTSYEQESGAMFHTYPSLRDDENRRALWAGMGDGTIATVATDGICTPLAVKVRGESVTNIVGGSVGVEPRVSVMYTETVVKRGWTLNQFADLVSTSAAKLLGLYPRKGVVAVGSDADLVVIAAGPRRLSAGILHESDYTPWDGYEVAGWPQLTMVRGRVITAGSEHKASSPSGIAIPRTLAC